MQGFLIYKEQIRKIRDEKRKGARTDEEKLPHDNWRLVARRRRLYADRRILMCIVLCGLLLAAVGIALTLVGFLKLDGYNPLNLVGPVIIGCGVIVLFLSVEICYRRKRILRQVHDEEEDTNKHYIDPKLIPYGFGHYREGEPVVDPWSGEVLQRITLVSAQDKLEKGPPQVKVIPPTPGSSTGGNRPPTCDPEVVLAPRELRPQ